MVVLKILGAFRIIFQFGIDWPALLVMAIFISAPDLHVCQRLPHAALNRLTRSKPVCISNLYKLIFES